MRPLRVLLAHNRYREAGGEDAVVQAEAALLRAQGVDVVEYLRDNRELEQAGAWRTAREALWSQRSHDELLALMDRHRPDVLHVHNTVLRISPSLFDAAARAGVPVVQTLHNFRLGCAQANFLRDGHVCTDCLGRAPWPALRHACWRGSRLQTAVLVASITRQKRSASWPAAVKRFIALNDWCRQRLVQAGVPADRLVLHGNFAADPGAPASGPRRGLLYVGRLSVEKGVAALAQAFAIARERQPGLQLTVIGDGPERARLAGQPGVRCLGVQSAEQVSAAMRQAQALVLPSIGIESMPRVLVEALAHGLPVLASDRGPLPELIGGGDCGWLADPAEANAMAEAMLLTGRAEAATKGAAARQRYLALHTPRQAAARLLAIYEQARG